MKFEEMQYRCPDVEALKGQLADLTRRLEQAETYAQAKAAFLEEEKLSRSLSTMNNLAYVRHSIDTRDAFYDGEMKFLNQAGPELQEYGQQWTRAMLRSKFRPEFTAEYGELMFLNAEIEEKTFDPAMIGELQQENDLTQEYEKLLASAQIPFEGEVYTLPADALQVRPGRRPPSGCLEGGGPLVQGAPGRPGQPIRPAGPPAGHHGPQAGV